MLCFEVYRNGNKLCTAGVGSEGVLTTLISWAGISEKELQRRLAEGIPEKSRERLELSVGGLVTIGREKMLGLTWVNEGLVVGDEIRVVIVDREVADPATERSRVTSTEHTPIGPDESP